MEIKTKYALALLRTLAEKENCAIIATHVLRKGI